MLCSSVYLWLLLLYRAAISPASISRSSSHEVSPPVPVSSHSHTSLPASADKEKLIERVEENGKSKKRSPFASSPPVSPPSPASSTSPSSHSPTTKKSLSTSRDNSRRHDRNVDMKQVQKVVASSPSTSGDDEQQSPTSPPSPPPSTTITLGARHAQVEVPLLDDDEAEQSTDSAKEKKKVAIERERERLGS